MGLSNGERYNKIIHSIAKIDDLRHDLNKSHDYYEIGKLPELTEKLWFEFLGNEANGSFWFFGGEFDDDCMKESGLVSAAFGCHRPERTNDWCREKNDVHDYLKYYDTAREMTKAVYLLDNMHPPVRGKILNIYLWIENLAYALCRYRDDFMDHYKGLNFVIRQIQGECFKIFKRDRSFAHAWMVDTLCDHLFTMDSNDPLNKWWQKQCLHHKIRIIDDEYVDTFHLFRQHQFKKEWSLQDRVDVTLALMDTRYHYAHQHKEFMEMIKEVNGLDLDKIQSQLDAIAAFKQEEEKDHYCKSCNFTDNFIDSNGGVTNHHYKDETPEMTSKEGQSNEV